MTVYTVNLLSVLSLTCYEVVIFTLEKNEGEGTKSYIQIVTLNWLKHSRYFPLLKTVYDYARCLDDCSYIAIIPDSYYIILGLGSNFFTFVALFSIAIHILTT